MGKNEAPQKPAAPAAQQHTQPSAPAAGPKKGKAGEPVAGMCRAVGCKHSSKRFDFCDEHYDHFKFGLLKKTGEMVPDYEKKFEHYVAYKAKRSAHKVA